MSSSFGTEATGENNDAHDNVLLGSQCVLPEGQINVKGYDFNNGVHWPGIFDSYYTMGFQATNLSKAIATVSQMIAAREKSPGFKLYLGYTSNMVSCGNREIIRYLVEHKMVDVLVTTAGGIEEDLIKCMGPTLLGEFTLEGHKLRKSGLNRIGNLLLPNANYCTFEDFLMPILDECLEEQTRDHVLWTPSKLIRKLGQKINHPESIYYWASKNDIPVFSPALTDGSIGDMMYFHSIKSPGLLLDIIQDIRLLNEGAVRSTMTGVLLLGGGLPKHHIFNANLMRNGADFAVIINTGNEFEGSDSGASPDEAVSWGKLKATAKPVKVYGEASLLFPIIVARTFAKSR